MNLDSCYRAGYVIKRHGFKGELRVHFEHTPPKKLESIFLLIDGMLVPFFIQHLSIGQPYSVVKLDEVDTEQQAEQLTQKEIYLPNAVRPRKKNQEIDLRSLIGFEVKKGAESLGNVTGVQEHDLNPLLVINHGGKELLIPIHEHFIVSIDQKKQEIRVELPEGFLDI